jgi:hypothetical protein
MSLLLLILLRNIIWVLFYIVARETEAERHVCSVYIVVRGSGSDAEGGSDDSHMKVDF